MSIEEKIKKLSSKQKVLIVSIAFLFVIQFPMRISYPIYSNEFLGDYRYLLIFLIISVFVALKRRNNSRIIEKNKTLTNILSNDYSLSSYASLSLLSLLYAIFQGIFLGLGAGSIFQGIGYLFTGNLFYFSYGLLSLILCLLFLIMTRIVIEGTSLIFKVAEDISKAVKTKE